MLATIGLCCVQWAYHDQITMAHTGDEEALPSFALQKHMQAADHAPNDDKSITAYRKTPFLTG